MSKQPKLEKSFIESMEWSLQNEGPDPVLHKSFQNNTRDKLEMSKENLVFQQNDLFTSAFPLMADVRRQGKLCDVVLKVISLEP